MASPLCVGTFVTRPLHAHCRTGTSTLFLMSRDYINVRMLHQVGVLEYTSDIILLNFSTPLSSYQVSISCRRRKICVRSVTPKMMSSSAIYVEVMTCSRKWIEYCISIRLNTNKVYVLQKISSSLPYSRYITMVTRHISRSTPHAA